MTTQRTFTTPILLPGDPSLALQAATKQYADTKVGSVASTDSTITVAGSATAPTIAVNVIAESQVTNLVTDLSNKQPLDSDLTTIAGLTATTDNFMIAASSAWASRTPTQAKTSLAITESDVSGLVTDLAAKAPTASPTFTGLATFTKMVQTPVALTDSTNIATDASLGNTFTVTLGGNRTMSIPTNATDGQMILYRFTQDGTGSRTITFTITGTGCFEFGTDVVAPTLSTVASKIDYVGFIYSSAASKWHGLAWARGY